jgi:hypothetical protein
MRRESILVGLASDDRFHQAGFEILEQKRLT